MAEKKVRSRIGRTFFYTTCHGSRVDENNDVVSFSIKLDGNIRDLERATKKAQRHFRSTRVIVRELHHSRVYESAPLEKFREIVDERTVIEED